MKNKRNIKREFHLSSTMEYCNNRVAENIEDAWYCYMSSDMYEKIFHMKLKAIKRIPWKRRVVKIYSTETKVAIYRIWKGSRKFAKSKDIVYVDRDACFMLTESPDDSKVELVLSPSFKVFFYWCHHDPVIRVSFKLGFVSVLIGAVALVIALICL